MQQFHPAVRNSAEVKFAVQAFAALNSNNFVRFFKLVQSASYLNACLLHCYFNQVSNASVLLAWGERRLLFVVFSAFQAGPGHQPSWQPPGVSGHSAHRGRTTEHQEQ